MVGITLTMYNIQNTGAHILVYAQDTNLYSKSTREREANSEINILCSRECYYSSSLFYYRVGFKKPTKKPYSKPSARSTSVTTMSFRSTSVRTFTSKISS